MRDLIKDTVLMIGRAKIEQSPAPGAGGIETFDLLVMRHVLYGCVPSVILELRKF